MRGTGTIMTQALPFVDDVVELCAQFESGAHATRKAT